MKKRTEDFLFQTLHERLISTGMHAEIADDLHEAIQRDARCVLSYIAACIESFRSSEARSAAPSRRKRPVRVRRSGNPLLTLGEDE